MMQRVGHGSGHRQQGLSPNPYGLCVWGAFTRAWMQTKPPRSGTHPKRKISGKAGQCARDGAKMRVQSIHMRVAEKGKTAHNVSPPSDM